MSDQVNPEDRFSHNQAQLVNGLMICFIYMYNIAAEKVKVDQSNKPVVDDYTRCETPKFVTENDLRETSEEFQNLMFNKETAVGFTFIFLCSWRDRPEQTVDPDQTALSAILSAS